MVAVILSSDTKYKLVFIFNSKILKLKHNIHARDDHRTDT